MFNHFRFSICFPKFRKYFGIFDVFIKEIVVFNIVFVFVVLDSIWWHGFFLFVFDIFPSSSSSSAVVVVSRRRRRPLSAGVGRFWRHWISKGSPKRSFLQKIHLNYQKYDDQEQCQTKHEIMMDNRCEKEVSWEVKRVSALYFLQCKRLR